MLNMPIQTLDGKFHWTLPISDGLVTKKVRLTINVERVFSQVGGRAAFRSKRGTSRMVCGAIVANVIKEG